MKALGASRAQILTLFLSEAFLLAVAGGLTGLVVGFGGVAALRGLYPAFPAEPPVWAVVAALGTSLVVGLVFGVLPARRAADLDPIAALGRGA